MEGANRAVDTLRSTRLTYSSPERASQETLLFDFPLYFHTSRVWSDPEPTRRRARINEFCWTVPSSDCPELTVPSSDWPSCLPTSRSWGYCWRRTTWTITSEQLGFERRGGLPPLKGYPLSWVLNRTANKPASLSDMMINLQAVVDYAFEGLLKV